MSEADPPPGFQGLQHWPKRIRCRRSSWTKRLKPQRLNVQIQKTCWSSFCNFDAPKADD